MNVHEIESTLDSFLIVRIVLTFEISFTIESNIPNLDFYQVLHLKLPEENYILWNHSKWNYAICQFDRYAVFLHFQWLQSELQKAGILGILDTEEHFKKSSRLRNILNILTYFCRILSHFKEIDKLYLKKLLLLK